MSDEISKDQLYGRYQAAEDRRAKLAMKAAHKALDIPDDDVTINTTTTHNHAPAPKSGGLKNAALVAAGVLGGGLGTLGVGKLLTPAPAIAAGPQYDAVVSEQQDDGTWKETQRQRLTPPAK